MYILSPITCYKTTLSPPAPIINGGAHGFSRMPSATLPGAFFFVKKNQKTFNVPLLGAAWRLLVVGYLVYAWSVCSRVAVVGRLGPQRVGPVRVG